jgi:hypothetical protein
MKTMFDINSGDTRAELANSVFKLLWQKHNGDIELVCNEAKNFIRLFNIHIPTLYEVVEKSVPLIAYMGYNHKDAINDFSETELKKRVEDSKKACVLFYSN